MIQHQKMPPDQQAWMLVTSRKQDLKKMAWLEDVGTLKWWSFSFWEEQVHFSRIWLVCCVLFSQVQLWGISVGGEWSWPGSIYLCSVENGMSNPPLVFLEPRFVLRKGGDFCLFPGIFSEWNLLPLGLFFANMRNTPWIWDYQNIYHISILEGSDALASCLLLYTAKLEADKHHVANKGGWKQGGRKSMKCFPLSWKTSFLGITGPSIP